MDFAAGEAALSDRMSAEYEGEAGVVDSAHSGRPSRGSGAGNSKSDHRPGVHSGAVGANSRGAWSAVSSDSGSAGVSSRWDQPGVVYSSAAGGDGRGRGGIRSEFWPAHQSSTGWQGCGAGHWAAGGPVGLAGGCALGSWAVGRVGPVAECSRDSG